MADKKLSSVSAVSDMNFVYAETSTGETVKISKADLASVVAGIILPAKVVSKDIRLVVSGDALIDGINQNTFNGFIAVNSTYSWRGFELYFVSNQQITKLASAPSNIYVSIVLKNGQYYLRNGDSVSPIVRVNLINIGDSIA